MTCIAGLEMRNHDIVALSAFVWNEYLLAPLIRQLRGTAYPCTILIGGAKIGYTDPVRLHVLYPVANVFVRGREEGAVAG
jgi:hypothetical protein